MSSIHFKFRSSLEYDTITFDGPGITLADLRESIVAKKKIARSADYTLEITNAQSKQVYSDETVLIPKNTSLIIKRVPVKRATTAAKPQQPEVKSNMSLEKLTKTADLANAVATEQDKIKAMMSQSAEEWSHPTQYVRKTVPPSHYTCFKCGQPGHFIRNCPSSAPMDPSLLPPKIRRNAGIPKDYATFKLEDETAARSTKLRQDNTRSYSPVVGSDIVDPSKVPPELQCPMCNKLYTDAVVVPCCGMSYCDECIRNYLLEHDLVCPSCQETTSPDNLIANKLLRTSATNFRNRRKPQAPTAAVNVTAVVSSQPADSMPKHADVKENNSPASVATSSAASVPSAGITATLPLSVSTTASTSPRPDLDSKPDIPAASVLAHSPIPDNAQDEHLSTGTSSGSSTPPLTTELSSTAASSTATSQGILSALPPTSGSGEGINQSIAEAIHAEIAGQRFLSVSSASRDTLMPATSRPMVSLPTHHVHLPSIVGAPAVPYSAGQFGGHHVATHPLARLPHPVAAPMHLVDPMYQPVMPLAHHDIPFVGFDPVPLVDPFYDVENGTAMPLSADEFYRAQQQMLNRDLRWTDGRKDDSSDGRRRHRDNSYGHSGSDQDRRANRRRGVRRGHGDRSRRKSSPLSSDDVSRRSPTRSLSPVVRSKNNNKERSRDRRRSPPLHGNDSHSRREEPTKNNRDETISSPRRRDDKSVVAKKSRPSSSERDGKKTGDSDVRKTTKSVVRRGTFEKPTSDRKRTRSRSASPKRAKRSRSPSFRSRADVKARSDAKHRYNEKQRKSSPRRQDDSTAADAKRKDVKDKKDSKGIATGEKPTTTRRIIKIKRRESRSTNTTESNIVNVDRKEKDVESSKRIKSAGTLINNKSPTIDDNDDGAVRQNTTTEVDSTAAAPVDDGKDVRRDTQVELSPGENDALKSNDDTKSVGDDGELEPSPALSLRAETSTDSEAMPNRDGVANRSDGERPSSDMKSKRHKKKHKRKHKKKHKKRKCESGDDVDNAKRRKTSDDEIMGDSSGSAHHKRKGKKQKHKHRKQQKDDESKPLQMKC